VSGNIVTAGNIQCITCIRLVSCTSVRISSISWTKPISNQFRSPQFTIQTFSALSPNKQILHQYPLLI